MINTNDLNMYPLKAEALAIAVALQSNDSLPHTILSDLTAAQMMASPVEAIVSLTEAFYAWLKHDDFDGDVEALATVTGRLAYFCSVNGFFGLGQRGLAIFNACRKALGETVEADDPAIDPKFVQISYVMPVIE